MNFHCSAPVTALTVSLGCAGIAAAGPIITGTGAGVGPHVKQFNGGSLATERSFFAYPATFTGGVRVAAGDVTGDGVPDIITGAGAGAPGGHVQAFDGATGAEARSFLSFPGFSGGIHVAAGDVTGDGRPDIVVGTGAGAPGGHVKVFDGNTGAEVRSFLAYDTAFAGGVRVAVGDIDGDGRADIITGAGTTAGPGATPHVKVFSGATNVLMNSFAAYGTSFAGGVYVASGDVNGDGFADIITGTGDDEPGAAVASHVKVFDGLSGLEASSFFAFDASFSGGVRVAAGDVNGDGIDDIITGAGHGSPGGHVRVFTLDGGALQSYFAYDPAFTGGVYVAGVPVPAPAGAVLVITGMLAACRRRRAHSSQ